MKPKLLKVNARRQVTLGELAEYSMYEVVPRPDGELLLRPVVVVPLNNMPKVQ